jgi:UDP-N-acetylmuramate dehydrogenase
MNSQAIFPIKYKCAEPLDKHTSFKIGGIAQYWAQPRDVRQLARLLAWCKKHKKRVRIIGAGSNILVSDRGVSGIVVKLDSAPLAAIKRIGSRVIVGAGRPLAGLVAFCARSGLSGAEFLSGIPGTVGGAIVGNAGTKDKSIGDLVEFVVVMDYNGQVNKIKRTDLKFSYRSSNLAKCVVLQACLKLVKRDKCAIRRTISGYVSSRRASQGAGWLSAGCCFKNPPGDSAGRLIDACGFKGARSGNAMVSKKHANFILNDGSASAADVMALMRRISQKVKKRYGIRLEPEIKIWR